MDLERLYAILRETTTQYRKGEEVVRSSVGGIERVDIYAMPHDSEADDNLIKVDCHFLVVGVDKLIAEAHRDELVAILADWPTEAWGAPVPSLGQEISYIQAGGVLGDQGAAFQLFALGQVLGFWTILTPAVMGIEGELADMLAGQGLISIDGYHPTEEKV